MKKLFHIAAILQASLVVVCLAQGPSARISVTNPSGIARQRATVSVAWTELLRYVAMDSKHIIVKEVPSGNEIASQAYDSNLDGKPEELLFQSDFAPNQTKVFSVSGGTSPGREFASLVDARFVEPRQDLAWENDRIAFRVYGPALAAEVNNGIDVWTKRVRYLIVKKWYDGEEQTPKIVYHIDHGEGADFFNVGRSLGCGGSGIWRNSRVYQPGVFSSYRIVAVGPIRACFELKYDNWNVDGERFKETKRIILDAGRNLNRVEVTFNGSSDAAPLEIACGLVKRSNTKVYMDKENGWMSLWGQVNDSLPNGDLGTGVVLDPRSIVRTTEDSAQYLMVGKAIVGTVFVYYAGAGWTRSGDFGTSNDWNHYLAAQVRLMKKPLKVSVSAMK